MRIVAGCFKSRRLKFIKSPEIRPTMDRVKESLFNVLGDHINRKAVLDIFAGCGSLGLEALSRGASKCVFVDNNRAALTLLKENIKLLHLDADEAEVIGRDWKSALKMLETQEKCFDFVFMDPPYKRVDMTQNVLMRLATSGILRPKAKIVVEHDSNLELEGELLEKFGKIRSLRFGETYISFLETNYEKA